MYGAVRFGLRQLAGTLFQMLPLLAVAGCSSFPHSYEMRLAEHLSETGAKMYGAYWCPHCAVQKDYFGGAAELIPYVECDPESWAAEVDLCQAAEINAYPTWIISGDRYIGTQPLFRLAEYSGFEPDEEAADAGDDPVPSPSQGGGGYSPAP